MAVFANSPFDTEVRIDCKMLKLRTKEDGDICILPDFNNTIFDIEDAIVYLESDTESRKIKIIGTGVAKFENNKFMCFGKFEDIN